MCSRYSPLPCWFLEGIDFTRNATQFFQGASSKRDRDSFGGFLGLFVAGRMTPGDLHLWSDFSPSSPNSTHAHRCPFCLVCLKIQGDSWFRWGSFHLPGPSIFSKGLLCSFTFHPRKPFSPKTRRPNNSDASPKTAPPLKPLFEECSEPVRLINSRLMVSFGVVGSLNNSPDGYKDHFWAANFK